MAGSCLFWVERIDTERREGCCRLEELGWESSTSKASSGVLGRAGRSKRIGDLADWTFSIGTVASGEVGSAAANWSRGIVDVGAAKRGDCGVE